MIDSGYSHIITDQVQKKFALWMLFICVRFFFCSFVLGHYRHFDHVWPNLKFPYFKCLLISCSSASQLLSCLLRSAGSCLDSILIY